MKKKRKSEVTDDNTRRIHALERKIGVLESQLKTASPVSHLQLIKLKGLVRTWTTVAQEALEMLLAHARKSQSDMTMVQVLKATGIPPELVEFDLEEEEFTEHSIANTFV